MITYDGKSYVDVVFRWKGSILQIDSRMWISLICTWLISVVLYIGVPADSFANSGTSYLAILGKVLTFLMVFRSKLTFDRFWKGRCAYQKMRGTCVQAATDISIYYEKDEPANVAKRQEIYRLLLAAFTAGHIHIRKEFKSLVKIYSGRNDPEGRWIPEEDKSQLNKMREEGLLTDAEYEALQKTGMSYVAVISTWFSQCLCKDFQDKEMHRNLMLDIESDLTKMISAMYDCEKISYNPFPFPYVQALTIFLLLFIYSMPLALFTNMGGWTCVMVPFIVLGFCGLDAVGAELEDPFGTDANDLPLPEWAQSTADACRVVMMARDGPDAVKSYNVKKVLDSAQDWR